MRKLNKSNISVYLTYSELFGIKGKEESIKNAIENKPLQDTILLLSRLQYLDKMDPDIKRSYLFYLKKKGLLTQRAASVIASRTILNYQCILTLWKYIFAYGTEEMLKKSSNLSENDLIGSVISLFAKIGDTLYRDESKSLEIELIRNIYFNNRPEVFASLGRSSYIYLDLAADESRYNKKEFIDIQSDFEKLNPYSMKEYFSIITSLISKFLSSDKKSTNEPVLINPINYYHNTHLDTTGVKVVNELSFSYSDAKKWAMKTIHNPWDFSLFQIKPLFKYSNECYFPVCTPFLEDKVYESFFFKVRQMYNDDKILGFLGRPFEEYAALLGEESVNQSKLGHYEFIEEFNYGENNSKKSPDVMIKLGNKLAVFEVKNRRVRAASFLQGDEVTIKKDFNKMNIEPVQQAFKSITEIIETTVSNKLESIEEVYIFSVTTNKCRSLGSFENFVKDKLKDVRESDLIKGFVNLDIEEFEALCYLISKKRSIFNIVNEFFDNPLTSFKDFLYQRNFPMKRPKFIDKRIMDAFDNTLEALGSKEKVKDINH
ncbi:hypothetical protein [Halobacillus litoralis]|uniref:NERD domain-containing protein n=1 Tax=Halobacillus litoralis TaxID=45668 RepID=A0A410MCE9_9BACI|nr:hypothetical protein [Halobacillus litoralis]QAS52353.1 hypothetical protein HLI_08975 [Halobacillus litoralis]